MSRNHSAVVSRVSPDKNENTKHKIRNACRQKWNWFTLLTLLVGVGVAVGALLALLRKGDESHEDFGDEECVDFSRTIHQSILVPLASIKSYSSLLTAQPDLAQPIFSNTSRAAFESSTPIVQFPDPILPAFTTLNQSGPPQPNRRETADRYAVTTLVPPGAEWLRGWDLFSENADVLPMARRAIQLGGGIALGLGIVHGDYEDPTSTSSVEDGLEEKATIADGGIFSPPFLAPLVNADREMTGIVYGRLLVDFSTLFSNPTREVGFQLIETTPEGQRNVVLTYPRSFTASANATNMTTVPPFQVADRTLTISCFNTHPRTSTTVAGAWLSFALLILIFPLIGILARMLFTRRPKYALPIYATATSTASTKKSTSKKSQPKNTTDHISLLSLAAPSILTSIPDALLILNPKGLIIDANPAALDLCNLTTTDLLSGITVHQLFNLDATNPQKTSTLDLSDRFDRESQTHMQVAVQSPSQQPSSSSFYLQRDPSATPSQSQTQSHHTHTRSQSLRDHTYSTLPASQSTYSLSTPAPLLPGFRSLTLHRLHSTGRIPVEATISPPVDSDGYILQVIMMRDTSKWVKELKEVTEMKENEELRSVEKSDFLAFVCHELRNPLHAIHGLASLLASNILPPPASFTSRTCTEPPILIPPHIEALSYLTSILDASRIMKSILSDMRILGKLEQNQLSVEEETVGWERMRRWVNVITNGSGKEKGVEVAFKGYVFGAAREWVPKGVRGDIGKIVQIISTLATTSSTPSLTLQITNVTSPSTKTTSTVSIANSNPTPATTTSKRIYLCLSVPTRLPPSDLDHILKGYTVTRMPNSERPLSLSVIGGLIKLIGADIRLSKPALSLPAASASHIQTSSTSSINLIPSRSISEESIAEDQPLHTLTFGIWIDAVDDLPPSIGENNDIISTSQSDNITDEDESYYQYLANTNRSLTQSFPFQQQSQQQQQQGTSFTPSTSPPPTPIPAASPPQLSHATQRKPPTPPNNNLPSSRPITKRRLGTHPHFPRPIRVLVVEDNAILLKIASTTLTRAGFAVSTALNGEQALQVIDKHDEKYFDVCLMDLLMPILDGFQTTAEIRRRGLTLPVIALTAKTLESDRLRCFKIGFNYFMTKPFQLGDIATIIRFMVGAETEREREGGAERVGGVWSKVG
ncbi:hypothetical protein HDU85_006443 [Gaertneriomyces sp. JEL0708]|nr:hypothetical protein HDU85_006443 [Gaertneriomyces sp. JEL0708]